MMVRICFLTFLALLSTASCSTVLIADYGMSKMIELTTHKPYCIIHKDRGTIRNMLLSADPRRVRQMTDDSIEKVENVCRSQTLESAHQGGFIYPGTKWCGPGNTAENHSDLGYHAKEDACCRDHDNCPENLLSKQCKQGICNNSAFTRSHCDCDATFRRCLQEANTETANTIGAIFFNVVQVICFQERSPCTKWQSNSTNLDQSNNPNCTIEFVKSDRYLRSSTPRSFSWSQKPAKILNWFFTKFGLL